MPKMDDTISRLTVLALGVALLTALGCAQQVGDIDRVQANALAKADFTEGEWYIRQTFSEVPPASNVGFIGLTGELEKITWEITEEYLIAYRSYENNPGSRRAEVMVDENGELVYLPGEEEGYSDEYKESPIAAYPISGHFDIQREYNSSTGEQTNVIVENTSDRVWHEREYFRVDWSNALTTELMFDNFYTDGMTFYVQDSEGSNDSIRMEYWDSELSIPGIVADDYEEGDLYYMDFTNRVLLDSEWRYCMQYYYTPVFLDECGASEVELRTSILRVPATSDYEPIYYDDHDHQKFGYFREERLVYDDRYGERVSNRIFLPKRHNIWSNTWQRDAEGEILRDDEGRMVPNSFANRTPEPVVYHVSPYYPEDLWDATMLIAEDWNRAFRRTVAAAQQVEIEEVRDMFYVCHNPVTEDDPAECGDVGLLGRVGDLRFNFLYWVDAPQAAGPLGYGPSSADPETGEIIAGQAFNYGASVDTYSQYALDLVRFYNGDLDIEDIDNADFIREDIRRRADPDVDPRNLMNAAPEALDTTTRIEDLNIREMLPEAGQQFLSYVDRHGMDDFVHRPGWMEHRRDLMAASGMSALTVDDEVLAAFGVTDLSELPDDVLEENFAGGLLTPRALTETENRRLEAANHTIYLAENLDETVVGLAMQYAGRTDYDNIWRELRELIFRAVAAHEVGHTLGLRHNFQGSFDSINYHDEFWELKTTGILGVTDENTVDVIPFRRPEQLLDIFGIAQMTPDQVEGRMREFQYSSIMDYSSGFNTDLHGIGKYDEAAIIYAYTSGRDRTVTFDPSDPFYNTSERGYVEVFTDVGDARSLFERYEGSKNPTGWDLLEVFHYSTIVTAMASTGGDVATWLAEVLDEGQERSSFEDYLLLPADSQQRAALIRQRLGDRRLVRYQDVVNQREAEVHGRLIEVPYLFLSDYIVGYSQTARRYDQGADLLEQSLNLIDRYRTLYPFTYFRRERLDWGSYDVFSTLGNRYFNNMVDSYQRWLFDVAVQGSWRPDSVLDNGWWFGAWASLNLMAEVMTTPTYGSYRLNSAGTEYNYYSYSERSDADLYIPPGVGRRPWSSYDRSLGYHYWLFPNEAGQFWAFYAANVVLTQMTSLSVRGVETADFRTYSIPVFLVFEEEMTRLYNAIWLQDDADIGPAVISDGDGKVEIERRLFVPIGLTNGSQLDPETGLINEHTMGFPTEEPRLDVTYGFSYQYHALLAGMMSFDENYSLHFHDQNRIFRLGSGETLEPGPDFEVVQVCDPVSIGSVCYAALAPIDDSEVGAAVRLINSTQTLVDRYNEGQTQYRVDIENNIERMNMMRTLYELTANPWYTPLDD